MPSSPLDAETLRSRPEPAAQALGRLLANAEYWLAFDLARFEPLLACAPDPFRALGVGLLLAHGEDLEGRLTRADLARGRAGLGPLPPDLVEPVEDALHVLEKGLRARAHLADRRAEGFRRIRGSEGVSPFALSAPETGRVEVEGVVSAEDAEVPLGAPITVRGVDTRGRPLPRPVPYSELGAPIWARDLPGARVLLLIVPGPYALQVPGPVLATRRIHAR